jgi:hypothetical protein
MGKLAIGIKQGETFFKEMRLKDDAGVAISTSGATITAEIRKAGDNTLEAEFDVSLLSDNWFKLQLEPAVTEDLPRVKGLVWDVRFETSGGVVYYTPRDSVEVLDTATEA